MNLFATPGNPMPPDPIVSAVRTRDGLTLRVARWVARSPRGSVTIAMGRSEFIEEYFEIVAALLERRLDVIIMDWRGQGQSDREIAEGRRGYVSSFAAYRLDLEALENQVIIPFARRPWFALGHSMGAAILLEQAHDGASPFERMVFSAPMIGIRLRYLKVAKRLTWLCDALGLGTRLIPKGREESIFTRRFENNILTSSDRQFVRLAKAMSDLPALAVGAPTIRWLAGAFRLVERFADPAFAVETQTPILIVAAGADRIIDTAVTERFALRLKAGRCITIPEARHQLIMESDDIVRQFWAAFDAFIPGFEAVAAKPEPSAQRLPKTALLLAAGAGPA